MYCSLPAHAGHVLSSLSIGELPSDAHMLHLLQIIGMDVVNVWEYPQEELTIKRVDALSYPDLFFGLQANSWLGHRLRCGFHAAAGGSEDHYRFQ